MKKLGMGATVRVAFVGVAAVMAAGLVTGAAAERPPNDANRLEATFSETRIAITDRAADLGIRQVIVSGTGTFDGFGAASEIAAVSQDHRMTPCGPGSSTSTILRRIVVPEGTLVLKTFAHRCPTSDGGILATGEYQVDGDASTGVFAGAWGNGTDTAQIAPPPSGAVTATISGKLHLVRSPGE